MGGADGTELAFAPANYLRELVDVAARYLRLNGAGTGPGPAELARWLGQPVHRLVEPTAAGTTSIAQARIAIEVLQAVVPSVPASLAQEYRSRAYQVFLREFGTSPAELARARRGGVGLRRDLAGRLGIDEVHLDAVTLSPRRITDARLAQLFGYPSTPDQTGEFQRWRREAIVDGWGRADADDRDGSHPRPVVDPDVIGIGHVRAGPARGVWRRRQQWIEEQLAAATGRLAGVVTVADFDDVVGGADATGDAAAYLGQVRAGLAAGRPGDFAEVASILVQAAKRQVFPAWRAEERAAGIVLRPSMFIALLADDPIAFPGPLRWRATWTTLADWRQTLLLRDREANAARIRCRAAITAVENEVLPALRDALLAQLAGPTVDELSIEFSLDFQAPPGIRTTRVDQAVASLRSLLASARQGQLTAPGRRATIVDTASFERTWRWLDTYSRWCSAMAAFAEPGHRLVSSLFTAAGRPTRPGGPTAAFTMFILGGSDRPGLIERSWLTPKDAIALAEAYLANVETEIDDTATLIRVLSRRRPGSALAAYRKLCAAVAGATAGRPMAPYLRELLSLVPTALARRLQDSGQYLAALDWYRAAALPPTRPNAGAKRPSTPVVPISCRINGVGPIGRTAA